MLKRALFFSNPLVLTLKDNQLVFCTREDPDEKRKVPIEDIGFVILENQMISVTLPLLNALVENNTAIIICDQAMMPSALVQPLVGNSIQEELYKIQVSASEPLKKNLWKQCVEAKIENQARLLILLGLEGDRLKPFYLNVKSGDSDNREAVAAKLYWEMLFGKEFSRQREGLPPNNLLNYGYAILRAAVTRSLVGSGLLPAFGIFHRNRYNPFPLSDDLMEPYRPFVDRSARELYTNGETMLTKEVKAKLISLLFTDCHFKKVCRPLDIGLTITTASLVKCLNGEQKTLSFPFLE
jgi:CRISPR-associated protein Cas1